MGGFGQYELAPMSEGMIGRVFAWCGVVASDAVPAAAQEIGRCVNEGKTARDFVNQVRGAKPLSPLASLDKSWLSLLFNSVALATYAHRHHRDAVVASRMFPFWRISTLTPACAEHATLDRFTARFDDPIWEKIMPPNSWCCGCLLEPVMDAHPVVSNPPSQAVQESCVRWIDRKPTHFPC